MENVLKAKEGQNLLKMVLKFRLGSGVKDGSRILAV